MTNGVLTQDDPISHDVADARAAMRDEVTTVGELRAAVEQFVISRAWEPYHTPKNLAMSIAIEAAEIMEHFQWYGVEESAARMADDAVERAEVADEIADVIIYCLSLANVSGIDISAAVGKKRLRHEGRFPVASVRGKLG